MGKRSGEKRQRRRVEVRRKGKGRQRGRRGEKRGRSSVTWALKEHLGPKTLDSKCFCCVLILGHGIEENKLDRQ